MANWTLCNLYAGFRGIEWAQTQIAHQSVRTFNKTTSSKTYTNSPWMTSIELQSIRPPSHLHKPWLILLVSSKKSSCNSRSKRMVWMANGSYSSLAIMTKLTFASFLPFYKSWSVATSASQTHRQQANPWVCIETPTTAEHTISSWLISTPCSLWLPPRFSNWIRRWPTVRPHSNYGPSTHFALALAPYYIMRGSVGWR